MDPEVLALSRRLTHCRQLREKAECLLEHPHKIKDDGRHKIVEVRSNMDAYEPQLIRELLELVK